MAISVLVVDDSSVMRAMILKTMRMTDLPLGAIHQAADGREGLAVLKERPVDLLHLSCHGRNEPEMINRIRKNPEWDRLAIVVISTEGSDTRIERLQSKGAVFIHKPFSPETIRDTVHRMLDVGDFHE
ncbi:MAG: response regulator [Thermodesulfobacteriota bacterium]